MFTRHCATTGKEQKALLSCRCRYVLSYDARLLWLLVLSRFTMGFGELCAPCIPCGVVLAAAGGGLQQSVGVVCSGSSRTVSRRYIADFVSKKDRMRASTGAFAQRSASVNPYVQLCTLMKSMQVVLSKIGEVTTT